MPLSPTAIVFDPITDLDISNPSNPNKRGDTKGSCTTGQTYKGDSLKDTKK